MKKEENNQIHLNKYKPNFLIIIGVFFNILFASVLSLILPLVVITIPTIVLNALLLIPTVKRKRYWAIWRIIPMLLSFVLAAVVVLSVFILLELSNDIYIAFQDFINNKIVFWTKKSVIPDWASFNETQKITDIVLIIFGCLGNVFIIFGWYKKKKIGYLHNEENEDKTNLNSKEKTKSKIENKPESPEKRFERIFNESEERAKKRNKKQT